MADPASLKAVLRVAETQITGVRIGQPVIVDTRNGMIQGQVSRIDPAAREGTFEIDASLIGPLPPSARPDLSVDGTIELERLKDVLKVGRPAFGQAQQTIGMFVLTPDGSEAVRTSGQTRAQFRQHYRDSRRPEGRRSGHHFRHVGVG